MSKNGGAQSITKGDVGGSRGRGPNVRVKGGPMENEGGRVQGRPHTRANWGTGGILMALIRLLAKKNVAVIMRLNGRTHETGRHSRL